MKAACIAVALMYLAVSAETLVYRQVTGNRESRQAYTVGATPTGFHVKRVQTIRGTVAVVEEIRTDSSYETQSWHYVAFADSTDISARRNGPTITVEGTAMGEPVIRKFTIDSRPWMQTFAFNLQGFIKGQAKKSEWWTVGVMARGDVKIADFSARKLERETVTINGRDIEAQRIKVSLNGALARLWQGSYLHDIESGEYVMYEGVNGPPGTPKTHIELVAVQ